VKLINVTLSFAFRHSQRKLIFHRFSHEFPKVGLIAITGDSGIGKTTLLRLLAGVMLPEEGRIKFPHVPGVKNKAMFMDETMGLVATWPIRYWLVAGQIQDFLLTTDLKMTDLDKPFWVLSGGQKMRTLLYVMLHQPASRYLLDEPTKDIGFIHRQAMIQWLTKLSANKLIIVSTHDPSLIAIAHQVVTIHSAFHIEIMNQTMPLSPHITLWKQKPLIDFKMKLITLAKVPKLGILLWCLSLLVKSSVLIMSLSFFVLQRHQSQLNHTMQAQRFIAVHERTEIAIADSPFQLVAETLPDKEILFTSIQQFSQVMILPDIQGFFPQTMVLGSTKFQIIFADLPFAEDAISTAIIANQQVTVDTITITGLPLPNQSPIQMHRRLNIVHQRMPLSWFEPPTLILSYWQWWQSLTTSIMQTDASPYMDLYWQTYSPTRWLLYSENSLSLRTIHTLLNETTTIRAHYLLDTHFDVVNPWLIATQYALQFFILWTHGLWMFIWSSRLHLVLHQHHQDVSIFKALGFPTLPVKSWLTQRLHHRWIWSLFILTSLLILSLHFLGWFSFLPGGQMVMLTLMFQGWFLLLQTMIRRVMLHA
jgi:ABC-type Mn2+/Zn2+ transport system ATPase subunit